MRTHRTVFLVPVMAAMLAAGCGAGRSSAAPALGATPAQIRADAFATVAARLYREEPPAGRASATPCGSRATRV